HAIASLAMVEAWRATFSPIYRQSAQRALDFIGTARNPGAGWRYGVRPGDDDVSVTGWMFRAVDAARRANDAEVRLGKPPSLTYDVGTFDGVRTWIVAMTGDTG